LSNTNRTSKDNTNVDTQNTTQTAKD
jgi:hypothetical protein